MLFLLGNTTFLMLYATFLFNKSYFIYIFAENL